MKTMFIINPVSGKGRGKRPYKIIRAIDSQYNAAGHDFGIRIWDRPDRINELLAEAVDSGYDAVVAAGGDGTINEIGRRLVGTNVALGIIPLGSGNGYARHLGYSRRPKKAISQLLTANTVEVDTGEFGGISFMNAAGIGIDAEVAHSFAHAKKRGLKTYIRLGVKVFLNYKTFSCKLVVDDSREYQVKNLLLMDIANGTEWGNGAKIAPLSSISDGWMEAIILEKTKVGQVPRLLKLLFQGKIYRHPNVKIVRGKKFEIFRPLEGNAHVDGESIQLGESILCTVHEKSVKLLVPEKRESV